MDGTVRGTLPWFTTPQDPGEGRDELLDLVFRNIVKWASDGDKIIVVTPQYKCIVENDPEMGDRLKWFDIIRTDGVLDRWRFWFNRHSVENLKDYLTPEKRQGTFEELFVC